MIQKLMSDILGN